MINKEWFKNLLLFFLAAAIVFSPEAILGKVDGNRAIVVNFVDILLVIFGLIWLFNFFISGGNKIKKPPLFLPIIIWLGIGFISILINWIFSNIPFNRGFFYFLKEIEFFFLYFYLFNHFKKIETTKFIANSWIFLGFLASTFIIYQYVAGWGYGNYGPSLYKEAGPFPSGGFFLILFLNLLNLFIYYYLRLKISVVKKIIFFLLIFLTAVGIFSSGSRTAIVGALFGLFLTLFIYLIKTRKLKALFLVLAIIVVFVIIIFLLRERVDRSILTGGAVWNPQNVLAGLKAGRVSVWQDQLDAFFQKNPINIFLGLGKSIGGMMIHDESHNQYVRNLIETGVIGSFSFFMLIFVILKKAWQGFLLKKNNFLEALSAGLLISTISMLIVSVAVEAFMVVKVAEIYWFFVALTMAVLTLNEEKKYEQ